jgi:tRNA(Ile)-lysidine synthase TilS/MesJ
VTAHHQDDQIGRCCCERCRRRAAGLAGIGRRALSGLVRPLLPFTRRDCSHATARDLPVHDTPQCDRGISVRGCGRHYCRCSTNGWDQRCAAVCWRSGRGGERRQQDRVLDLTPDLGLVVQEKACRCPRECVRL